MLILSKNPVATKQNPLSNDIENLSKYDDDIGIFEQKIA